MDSVTHVVLGAAVGEVVLGKKVGNRAMLWGAIGGTLPDMDVIDNLTTDPLGALAFHREISHSFTFAVIAPLALGWMIHHLYQEKGGGRWWRDMGVAWGILGILLVLGAFVLPIPHGGAVATGLATGTIMLLPALVVGIRERYRRRPSKNPNATWRDWSWLMFGAIITHQLLDCCTSFGTQVFQPFSDYRVALDNISVVDPLYTFPFLICVLMALRLARNTRRRRLINYVGLGISTLYILFTFYNKSRIDGIFEASLKKEHISYERYMTAPTLLNNILWQGVAEGDSAFYYGMYSLLDDDPEVDSFVVIPKNYNLLKGHAEDRPVRVLRWFSKGYYSVVPLADGRMQVNDLRFGLIERAPGHSDNFIFKFILEERGGKLIGYQAGTGRRDLHGAFGYLLQRIQGD